MANDTGFAQEIDESIRAERLEQLWRRSGKTMLAVFVLVLVATIAGVVWKGRANEALAQQTHALLHAKALSDAGDPAHALAVLDEATFPAVNMSALADIRRGETALSLGDTSKVGAWLAHAAAQQGADGYLRDYAALGAGTLAQNAHQPANFSDAGGVGKPFSASIREARAALLLAEGKKAEAKPLLQSVLDERSIPLSERTRVTELLAYAGGSVK